MASFVSTGHMVAPEILDSSENLPGLMAFSHADGMSLEGTQVNSVARDMSVHGAAGNMYTRVVVNTSPTLATGSVQPIMTRNTFSSMSDEKECETYARLLWSKGRGYPLWWPEPDAGLPPEYREKGISIGDVGIVTAEGNFDYLFNVRHPREHPINSNGVPPDFQPIELPPNLEIWSRRDHSHSAFMSKSIAHLLQNEPFPRTYTFQCSAPDGAILLLPEGATQDDLKSLAEFQNYAVKYGQSWYQYATALYPHGRGRIFRNGSICLVTGYTKGSSWLVSSFSDVPQDSFQITFSERIAQHNEGYSYQWDRSGPTAINYGPVPVHSGKENQCMFLRGFTVTVNRGIWAKLSSPTAASQIIHEDFTKFYSKAAHSASYNNTFSSALSLMGLYGWSSQSNNGNRDSSHAVDAIPNFPTMARTMTPPQSVNEILLDLNPEAQIAITHDNNMLSVLVTHNEIVHGSISLEQLKAWISDEIPPTMENRSKVVETRSTHDRALPRGGIPEWARSLWDSEGFDSSVSSTIVGERSSASTEADVRLLSSTEAATSLPSSASRSLNTLEGEEKRRKDNGQANEQKGKRPAKFYIGSDLSSSSVASETERASTGSDTSSSEITRMTKRRGEVRESVRSFAEQEEIDVETRRQRDMFAKLPTSSYQNLHKARTQSVGFLSQMMGPSSDTFSPRLSYRHRMNSENNSRKDERQPQRLVKQQLANEFRAQRNERAPQHQVSRPSMVIPQIKFTKSAPALPVVSDLQAGRRIDWEVQSPLVDLSLPQGQEFEDEIERSREGNYDKAESALLIEEARGMAHETVQ